MDYAFGELRSCILQCSSDVCDGHHASLPLVCGAKQSCSTDPMTPLYCVSRVHPEEWWTRHGERLLILVCGWHVQQASRRYCFCPHHASPDLESVPANIIHEQLLVVCFPVLPCFGFPNKECIVQVLLSTLQAALLCRLMAMKTSQ